MFTTLRTLLAASLLIAAANLSATIPALADPVVPGEEHCVVNIRTDDVLNIRRHPTALASIVTARPYGSCGIVITGSCTASWCPVDDGHYAGWANRRYLSMVSPALYCVSGVASNDRLNVRAYPATSSRILVSLPPHQCDIAFLPYAVGNWQKIRVAGWEGWASRFYLSGE